MKIFIIGTEGIGKIYGMIVTSANKVLLIKEIHDRYDFAAAVLALHPNTTEDSFYIKTFEQTHPKLSNKLLEFIEIK